MLIILNKQMVMTEMLEWARLRLAEVMMVSPELVLAEWELNDQGVIVPHFSARADAIEGVSNYKIKEVIKAVAHDMRGMLAERLADLTTRRTPVPDLAQMTELDLS